ncbi:hypothetical protein ACFVHS_02335 [Streptomyces sp. NPDC057746]|uniref:hypothetical protein n=1 Tax=Streptomyces sp. NPDC057746 TaxID=3346237 RepID=UPI003675AA6C
MGERRQHGEDFADHAALLAWLTDRIGAPNAELLLRLLEDDDRERQLSAISAPLANANRAWRALGLPEIDNRDWHERQFAAWLQRNRPVLAERIRDAYTDVCQSGQSPAGYVKLRDFWWPVRWWPC